jgi:Ca-activated chloride channel homolog
MKPMNVLNGSLLFILVSMLLVACGDNSSSTSSGSSTTEASTPASDRAYADATVALDPDAKGAVSLRRNFYFVFDGSGSMKDVPRKTADSDQQFSSKIQGAKWAVTEFLTKVPKDANLGLYVFDKSGPREVLPLGPNNRTIFLQKVQNIHAKGGTPLGTAIAAGSEALQKQYNKQLGYGEYRLIVITDGEATDNLQTGVARATKNRTPIYTIGFDMGNDHALRKHSISYRSADSAKQLEHALEQAIGELDIFDPADFRSATKSK